MPMAELSPERIRDGKARTNRDESKCLQAARNHTSDPGRFAFACHLNVHDLGATARLERHTGDGVGDAIPGQNVRHACREMCKNHTRRTWRVRARAGQGIEESSIEWRRDASLSDSW